MKSKVILAVLIILFLIFGLNDAIIGFKDGFVSGNSF